MPNPTPHSRIGAAALAAVLALTGCGADTDTELTVLAAASLRAAFTEIGAEFERANPGTKVDFSFAGSSTLAQQATAGAPADVIALAGDEPMRQVTAAGSNDGTPVVFARNQLVIAVGKANPKRIGSLAGLIGPDVTVALCAPQVPCGAAALAVLGLAGLDLTPVTQEPDVNATLTKVRLGEVDAALVYRTDIPPDDPDVSAVEFPESDEVLISYYIATLAQGPELVHGHRFVEFVRSAAGQSVLARLGFAAP